MKIVREWVDHDDAEPEGVCTAVETEEKGSLYFTDEQGGEWHVTAPKRMKIEPGEEFSTGNRTDTQIELVMAQEHPTEWVKHYDAPVNGATCEVKGISRERLHLLVENQANLSTWTVGQPSTFSLEVGDVVRFSQKLASSIKLEFLRGKDGVEMNDKAEMVAALVKALTEEKGPKDVNVERVGSKIILPPGMSYKAAREWLTKKEEEENTKVAINEEIDAFPLDGAHAFMMALKETYGWTESLPTPGFWGSTPPAYISLDRSVREKVEVIWGRVAVPAITGYFETGVAVKDSTRVIFKIGGETKQKHMGEVQKIAALTRKFVKEFSLYKGKAIRVTFPNIHDEKFNPLTHAPRFIDTTTIREADLVFPGDIMALVETTLFAPIRATTVCREARIPLKRGILLEGQFGTGKTLTAYVTAKLAEQHGWTFVYVEDVRKLDDAMRFAKQYTPAVVFAEDIDRVDRDEDGEQQDRGELMNQILSTIDGVDMKGLEIMVVLTTNHVEYITQGMLRPGRLDAVIPVRTPDQMAAAKLVQLFAGAMLAPHEDLGEVGRKLSGNIPAVIREVVERSKLATISRLTLAGEEIHVDRLQITSADLMVAADGMMAHLALLKVTPPDLRSDYEKAAAVLADAIKPQSREATAADLPYVKA